MAYGATAEQSHNALSAETDDAFALTDDQLMMVTGGGEESMPVQEAGFIRDGVFYDLLKWFIQEQFKARPEGNQSPGPNDGAHGGGSI